MVLLTKKDQMKYRMLLLAIFLPLVLFANAETKSERIPVQVKSCKFLVTVPEGWDTIPHSAFVKKLGEGSVVLALYPKGTEYFEDKYVLLSFQPTVKSLNEFSFETIVKELKEMNDKNRKFDSDSIHVIYNGMDTFSNDGKLGVSMSLTVYNDSSSINCLQNLLMSKFGYISITCYNKEQMTSDFEDIVQEIIKGINIDIDYLYIEPQEKSGFTFTNVAIGLGAGILIFLVLMFFENRKKK